MEYLWVINGETELSQLLASDDLSCIPYTDYYSYATRAWHPDDCAPDDYEDYDPNEDGCGFIDFYGGCWEDDQEVPDFATYLGELDGHEYYAVGWDMAMNWEDANESAFAWGGYLATITSPEENEFLRSSIEYAGINEDHYIGLYDQNMDGTGWSWITGEPLDYTNWAAGEPNGPGQEDCGEFYNSFITLYFSKENILIFFFFSIIKLIKSFVVVVIVVVLVC